LPSDVTETYVFIAAQAAQFAVTDLCQTIGVSRSGYYAWQQRPTPTDELTPQVTAAFWRHARRYGSRRLTAELQAEHLVIGRRRVRRIMQTENLRAIQPKSFVPRTTNSRHGGRMSPNLLADVVLTHPHQVYVSDITYLPLLGGGWAYLATWLDLYTRRIVGWAVAEKMEAELIIRALQQSIVRIQPPRGLLVHSDRGGQYVDTEFRALLTTYGFKQSMSRAGETYDNAHAESLFSRYKAELLEDGSFRDVAEAELETFDYIERYYNPLRRHSSLGYISPMEFEKAYYQRAKTNSLKIKERIES
jgi:transposase InsO family protein